MDWSEFVSVKMMLIVSVNLDSKQILSQTGESDIFPNNLISEWCVPLVTRCTINSSERRELGKNGILAYTLQNA